MSDSVIRNAFHRIILYKEHQSQDTQVVNELGLKNGEFRADIAVLNGKMVGYEIKTAKDTLSRLPSQVAAYSQVFEKAFIVTAEKHHQSCLNILPDWWGIYLIEETGLGEIKFKRTRPAKANQGQHAFSVAQLLWKDEALEVANAILGLNLKPRLSRHEIYDLLARNSECKQLSNIVLQYLKKRTRWR